MRRDIVNDFRQGGTGVPLASRPHVGIRYWQANADQRDLDQVAYGVSRKDEVSSMGLATLC